MDGTQDPDPYNDPHGQPEVEEDTLHVVALRRMKIRRMWESIQRRAEAAETAEQKNSSSEEETQ